MCKCFAIPPVSECSATFVPNHTREVASRRSLLLHHSRFDPVVVTSRRSTNIVTRALFGQLRHMHTDASALLCQAADESPETKDKHHCDSTLHLRIRDADSEWRPGTTKPVRTSERSLQHTSTS